MDIHMDRDLPDEACLPIDDFSRLSLQPQYHHQTKDSVDMDGTQTNASSHVSQTTFFPETTVTSANPSSNPSHSSPIRLAKSVSKEFGLSRELAKKLNLKESGFDATGEASRAEAEKRLSSDVDYFAFMSVSPNSSKVEMMRAWRKLWQKHRPKPNQNTKQHSKSDCEKTIICLQLIHNSKLRTKYLESRKDNARARERVTGRSNIGGVRRIEKLERRIQMIKEGNLGVASGGGTVVVKKRWDWDVLKELRQQRARKLDMFLEG